MKWKKFTAGVLADQAEVEKEEEEMEGDKVDGDMADPSRTGNN